MSFEGIDTSGFSMMTEHEERDTYLGFLIVSSQSLLTPLISVELPTIHVALESQVEAVLFDGPILDLHENFISSENASVSVPYVTPLEGLAVSVLFEEFATSDDSFAA